MMRLVLISALIALTACAGRDTPERQAEAAALARAYFQQVQQHGGDRGWSLIHPTAQGTWVDYEHYAAVAGLIEPGSLDLEVLRATRCDDGVACLVCVNVPAGEDGLPRLLQGGDNVQFPSGAGQCGNGVVGVNFAYEPWGARGIFIFPPEGGP
jgi:hypothetical protein